MKYYVGQIDEQYGEYEVEQSILFATTKNPSDILEEIAKDWCDEMAYGAGRHYEVTKATYDELKDKRVFTEIFADEEVKAESGSLNDAKI